VYAQPAEAKVSHLRTTKGGDQEIGLIIERNDGKVLALEAKLGGNPKGNEGQHIEWLKKKIGDRLLDSAIITTGTDAYRRKDEIAVIPLALLAP